MQQQLVQSLNRNQIMNLTAWKWMRYSGFLLIPLVWGHVLLQDIIVGVHKIDLDYVALRWASVWLENL